MGALANFSKDWDAKPKEGLREKIGKILGKDPPLRYKIALANYKLKTIVNRLDFLMNKMKERDKVLFEKVVEALMVKDEARAAIYASEVAEVRKLVKYLLVTQVALEQVMLRLETIEELGEVAVAMAPLVSVLRQLRGMVKGVIPEVGFELAELEEMMNSMIIEMGSFADRSIAVSITSSEAKKILEEATAVAEQRMKESFPELPTRLGEKVGIELK